MNQLINLTTIDSHTLPVYISSPTQKNKDQAIIILQEVFGVNHHIRKVCDEYTELGYYVLSPVLFERIDKDIQFNYSLEELTKGRELRTKLGLEKPLIDIETCLIYAKKNYSKVGVLGYCWGGSLAWVCACKLNFDWAVSYYGAQIIDFINEKPKIPTLLHFGEEDKFIKQSDISKIQKLHPSVELIKYKAGHGFNCNEREDYNKICAENALKNTLNFIQKQNC